MVPKAFVRQYAVSQQIDETVADQEIVLHYALALLNEIGLVDPGMDGAAPGPLLFKGGTALRKCVFGSTGRFSQDIDLDATAHQSYEDEISDALTTHSPYHGVRFEIETFRHSEDGNFSGTIAYEHAGGERTLRAADQLSPRSDPRPAAAGAGPADVPQARRMRRAGAVRTRPLRDDRREDHGLQPPRDQRIKQGRLRPLPMGAATVRRPARATARRPQSLDRPTHEATKRSAQPCAPASTSSPTAMRTRSLSSPIKPHIASTACSKR
jgi:hypothetical protein